MRRHPRLAQYDDPPDEPRDYDPEEDDEDAEDEEDEQDLDEDEAEWQVGPPGRPC